MADLHDIGRALYGNRWQSALARDIGVTSRTVRRWAAGDPIPQGVWPDVLTLARARRAKIDKVIESLS